MSACVVCQTEFEPRPGGKKRAHCRDACVAEAYRRRRIREGKAPRASYEGRGKFAMLRLLHEYKGDLENQRARLVNYLASRGIPINDE